MCSTPLHDAASVGDSDAVLAALQTQDANADDACETKVYPIMLAAAHGNEDVVSILLEHGAIVDVRHLQHGGTPLFAAAQSGHAETAQLLLSSGADVNHKDDINQTALYYASQNGHAGVVKVLLAAGADTSVATHTGLTPWMAAIGGSHREVAALLEAEGAPSGAPHATLYLMGALPLPLANAEPFERALLGAYEFERLLAGAGTAVPLKLSEEASKSVANVEQRLALESEQADAERVAQLALAVPIPVYRKRGTANTRLWFDSTAAVWLVSSVAVPDGDTNTSGSQWREFSQFLRAIPIGPAALDATLAKAWHVRLVAASVGGDTNETWVAAPDLQLLRGEEGEALWREARSGEKPGAPRATSGRTAGVRAASGGSSRAKKGAQASSPPPPLAAASEVEMLRALTQSHPALASLVEETERKAKKQVQSDARFQRQLERFAKMTETKQRMAEDARQQQEAAHAAEAAKVREIFASEKFKEAREAARAEVLSKQEL